MDAVCVNIPPEPWANPEAIDGAEKPHAHEPSMGHPKNQRLGPLAGGEKEWHPAITSGFGYSLLPEAGFCQWSA